MKEIKFHEGGMPLNIDDLKLLQENSFATMAAFLKVFAKEKECFLLHRLSATHQNNSVLEAKFIAGVLVFNGMFLEIPETTLKVCAKESTLFLWQTPLKMLPSLQKNSPEATLSHHI